MQLSAIRKTVKGLWGREYSTTEDGLYTDDLLNQCINDAHRWLAERTRCYRITLTKDLPVGAFGTSTVELDCDIIDIDRENIRALLGGTWGFLEYHEEHNLLDLYGGPFENLANVTSPCHCFLRLGDTKDAHRVLEVVPGSDTEVTDAIRLTAWIYPGPMTQDDHAPALQPAEHSRLFNRTIYEMARVAVNRGWVDATPIMDRYERAAEQDATDLKRILERTERGGTRTIHTRGDW